MKKIISLFLILIMLSSLVACDIVGNIKPDSGTDPDDEGFDIIIGDNEDENNSDDQGNSGTTDPGQDEDPNKPNPTPDPTPDPGTGGETPPSGDGGSAEQSGE